MQTLTVTAARQNLGGWLKKAASGEEIGVIIGNQVIAFRPVAITAADYAETEYGLSSAEATEATSRIVREVAGGALTEYKPGMFSNAPATHKTLSSGRKKTKRT